MPSPLGGPWRLGRLSGRIATVAHGASVFSAVNAPPHDVSSVTSASHGSSSHAARRSVTWAGAVPMKASVRLIIT